MYIILASGAMAVHRIKVCRDVSSLRVVLASHQVRRFQIMKKAPACGFLAKYEWKREDAAVWAASHPAIDSAIFEEAAFTVFHFANRFFPEVFSNLAFADCKIWIWPLNPTFWHAGFPAKAIHFVWVAEVTH